MKKSIEHQFLKMPVHILVQIKRNKRKICSHLVGDSVIDRVSVQSAVKERKMENKWYIDIICLRYAI